MKTRRPFKKSSVLDKLHEAAAQLPAARSQPANQAALTDDLAEFEHFRENILPEIRQAYRENKKPDDILRLTESLAAARLATIAATTPDESKALQAIKELLDRTQGKAVERKAVAHKFADVDERELDALLESALTELDDGKEEG